MTSAKNISQRNVLLSIQNLTISLDDRPGTSPVVNGLTFDVHEGECVGIVGESGSGKSL
ncbi:MAG: ATP-binding cassette domain-containing protein, partial [Actinobacteria bacterium]|nr:ATP-binding cassette domain-containing protein [Actinomycetota bacterium]